MLENIHNSFGVYIYRYNIDDKGSVSIIPKLEPKCQITFGSKGPGILV